MARPRGVEPRIPSFAGTDLESARERKIGAACRSRTHHVNVRSVDSAVRRMPQMVLRPGVDPGRRSRSGRSPSFIRARRSPELRSMRWWRGRESDPRRLRYERSVLP